MNCPECEREWLDEQRSCPCGYGRQEAQKRIDDVIRSTYREQPYGIDRETFGHRLFQTIYTIGRLLTIRKHRAVAVHTQNHLWLAELDMLHSLYTQELADHMVKLSPDEVGQVVERYPWCAHV